MDREDGPLKGSGPNLDTYETRAGISGVVRPLCSYCGSMSPDEFMEAVKAHVEIGPTDKAYKFYVDGMKGKFYSAHLSEEQQREFLTLVTDLKVNWGYPGYPYSRIYLPALL